MTKEITDTIRTVLKAEPICANCIFFSPYESGDIGQCRKECPITNERGENGSVYAVWPIVALYQWCGRGKTFNGVNFEWLKFEVTR